MTIIQIIAILCLFILDAGVNTTNGDTIAYSVVGAILAFVLLCDELVRDDD